MAPRFLWLGFGVAEKKFQFHSFEDESMKGKFNDMFEPFPFDSPEPLLVLPHDPRINDSEGLPRKLPFSQALAWGDGLENESSIFFIGFHGKGDEHERFCVKVLFNTEKAKPDDYSYLAVNNMLADAKFYARALRDIAGGLVPRHYGVWRARTGKWGGTILCSITEWAGHSWAQIAALGDDMTPVKKLLGRTIERLHDRNIHHNRLHYPSELHHILFRLDETDAGLVTRCFVVDFSKARTEPCTRNLPILPVDADICQDIGGCSEALNVLCMLNMYEKDVKISPSTRMYQALRFHERYSALHPSLNNAAVMMVQRHHFFNDDFPLEPDIEFGFRPDGKVVFDMKDSDQLAKCLPEEYVASLLS